MKKNAFVLIAGLLFYNIVIAQVQNNNLINFDENWRFYKGAFYGAQNPLLDDSKWRLIDVPHDWSIEDLPKTNSPFQSNATSQVSGGFTVGGTAWYRKAFEVNENEHDKNFILQFDGVYMNASVYVNGQLVGNHPYGYTSFYYDITKHLKIGEKNIIAVEVKNEGQNSRWYSGSGIYRHVWLKKINPVHIAQWGTFVTTPIVNQSSAKISIKTQLVNKGDIPAKINVTIKLLNPAGTEVATVSSQITLNPGENNTISRETEIKNPQLWDCENPVVYSAITSLHQDGKLLQTEQQNFGIRTISFSVNNGFQLNGKTTKLKGGCIHHDNGPLGAKAYDRAEERKVELLKASGFNAIRCAHNPPSPAFLDACDRLGMLVIDEAFDMWDLGNNPYDYHLYFNDWWHRDIESMLLRDRNHPSIIMWSIGNEITNSASPAGVETAKQLVKYLKVFDSTRPVTAAVNGLNKDKDPFFGMLDIAGYNYAVDGDPLKNKIYAEDHDRKPDRIIFCSESYPLEAFRSWMEVEENPYVIGDFVWTAIDYIGEASIGWLGYFQSGNFFPWNLAFCGDIDICGWKRPQSFYRDVLWKKNQLSVFVKSPIPSFKLNPNIESWSKWNWMDALPEWNWKVEKNTPMEVSVYSSCEEAELFFNGKSLGRKLTNQSTQFMASWIVTYQPGEIKAVGYSTGKIIKQTHITTADKVDKIKLTADRKTLKADNQDLSYITVELVDKQGNINPEGEKMINFSVSGDAEIVGVGNANPVSLESYQQQKRKTWKGKCLVIIKAGKKAGSISLFAKSTGMKPSKIILESK